MTAFELCAILLCVSGQCHVTKNDGRLPTGSPTRFQLKAGSQLWLLHYQETFQSNLKPRNRLRSGSRDQLRLEPQTFFLAKYIPPLVLFLGRGRLDP